METFSRSQILQDFNFQCSKLASNNNRGFKQAFRVTTTKINDTYIRIMVYKVWIICFYGADSQQELNDVGKDLPSRAGSLEANREKNRYHCILPCEWTASDVTSNYDKRVCKYLTCFFFCSILLQMITVG